MNRKKMVVISATNHYKERAKGIIEKHKADYDVTYVTSDFAHIPKEKFVCDVENSIQLHVIPYYKNISVSRILSHCIFSLKAFFLMMKLKPEKVYAEIPNNTLAMSMSLYKFFSKCELTFDIFDMWPESFPNKSQNALFKIAMGGWRWTRNGFLKNADEVWIECDYYRELMNQQGIHVPMETHYLKNTSLPKDIHANIDSDRIDICYVGSINNVTDVDLMVSLLGKIQEQKKVVFHLVGAGESLDILAQRLRQNQVEVICYGIVYNQNELQAIFDKCSFGINMIKDDLAIGVTMKSVTYFLGGVPIINTVPGDTQKFVDDRLVGINVKRELIDETVKEIIDCPVDKIIEMKKNAVSLFVEVFYDA